MANSLEERIQKLDAQKKTLQAKLNRQKRTEDTRKKILLGSLLMAHMENDRIESWVRKELPKFLSRENDKKLFQDWLSREKNPPQNSENIWQESQTQTTLETSES